MEMVCSECCRSCCVLRSRARRSLFPRCVPSRESLIIEGHILPRVHTLLSGPGRAAILSGQQRWAPAPCLGEPHRTLRQGVSNPCTGQSG